MAQIDIRKFRELGKTACANRASRLDAGNANSFACETTASEVRRGIERREVKKAVMDVQSRCRISLFDVLELAEDEQQLALIAFAAGCYEWLSENPD